MQLLLKLRGLSGRYRSHPGWVPITRTIYSRSLRLWYNRETVNAAHNRRPMPQFLTLPKRRAVAMLQHLLALLFVEIFLAKLLIIVFLQKIFCYFAALLRWHLNFGTLNLERLDFVCFEFYIWVSCTFVHCLQQFLFMLTRTEKSRMFLCTLLLPFGRAVRFLSFYFAPSAFFGLLK